MKKWLLPAGAMAVILIGGFFVLSFYLVKEIEPQLRRLLGPGFSVAEMRVKPLYIHALGIAYTDPQSTHRLLEVEEIKVYPALLSILKPPIRIREATIHRPSFFFHRTQEGIFVGPWKTERREKAEETAGEEKSGKEKPVSAKINRFRIVRGAFFLKDMKTEGPAAEVRLREVDLELQDVRYPIVSASSPLELTGKIEGGRNNGNMDLRGWVNLQTMEMEIVLKIRGMDLKVLEPYYRRRVTADIESGSIHAETKITVREKTIDATGRLELTDLQMGEDGTVFWVPVQTFVTLLKEKGDRIEVPFHMKGNLGDPQFNLQETLMLHTAVALLEALGIPIRKSGEEILGNLIRGEKGLAEELKALRKRLKEKKRE